MRCVTVLVGILSIGFSVGWISDARAQSGSRDLGVPLNTGSSFGHNADLQRIRASTIVRRAPTIDSVSRYTGGLAGRSLNSRSKPFEGLRQSPTLSPYLNLLRDGGLDGGGLPNYHTFVRPTLEQQRVNQQQQRSINRVGSEVRAVNRQLISDPLRSAGLRPTGHQTTYMYHSHYYALGRR